MNVDQIILNFQGVIVAPHFTPVSVSQSVSHSLGQSFELAWLWGKRACFISFIKKILWKVLVCEQGRPGTWVRCNKFCCISCSTLQRYRSSKFWVTLVTLWMWHWDESNSKGFWVRTTDNWNVENSCQIWRKKRKRKLKRDSNKWLLPYWPNATTQSVWLITLVWQMRADNVHVAHNN